jgi:hypothetical protein
MIEQGDWVENTARGHGGARGFLVGNALAQIATRMPVNNLALTTPRFARVRRVWVLFDA